MRSIAVTAVVAAAAGCGGDSAPRSTAAVKPTATPEAASAGTCPVTLPNGNSPPDEKPSKLFHGNGRLWTAMWPYNVIVATRDYIRADGSIEMKWPWSGAKPVRSRSPAGSSTASPRA